MNRFPCPYLRAEVELTEEREGHIAERHTDLLPEHRARLVETLAAPDQVRRSVRFGSARLFSRSYTDVPRGNHLVVVVVSEPDATRRHWIIAAYLARKLPKEKSFVVDEAGKRKAVVIEPCGARGTLGGLLRHALGGRTQARAPGDAG